MVAGDGKERHLRARCYGRRCVAGNLPGLEDAAVVWQAVLMTLEVGQLAQIDRVRREGDPGLVKSRSSPVARGAFGDHLGESPFQLDLVGL
jgi:hypothetical protein